MKIKCFFLTPTNKQRIYLRRSINPDRTHSHYHDAFRFWKDVDMIGEGLSSCSINSCKNDSENCPDLSEDWPVKCEKCDYIFDEVDSRQRMVRRLYERQDTSEVITLNEAPVGAMYYATWLEGSEHFPKGPDGHILEVMVPDGMGGSRLWSPDDRASNCTMPNDKIHRCWVRHGIPPEITVDKNGVTCNAGAGSIMVNKWHGFLKNGYLVD